jgi:hypothetical protein
VVKYGKKWERDGSEEEEIRKMEKGGRSLKQRSGRLRRKGDFIENG